MGLNPKRSEINKIKNKEMEESFLTPILFLVFNRPDKTKLVFDKIRAIKPKYLYIAADGPRKNKENEFQKCNEVRSIVGNIDWDCEPKFLFRHENLGCSAAITSAIDWFFQNVECGIIFEDDCLPDLSFFPYCRELLQKYKDDNKVMMISGSNLGMKSGDSSYFFSNYGQIWGWATWRRAWEKYERTVNIKDKDIKFNSTQEKNYWRKNFSKIIWDVQWAVYSVWKNNGIAILPNVNLISNIGFGSDATNYTDKNNINSEIDTNPMIFPLTHPNTIMVKTEVDNKIFNHSYFVPLYKRIIRGIKSRY